MVNQRVWLIEGCGKGSLIIGGRGGWEEGVKRVGEGMKRVGEGVKG